MHFIPFINVHNHRVDLLNNNSVSICSFFVQNIKYALYQYIGYFSIGLHPWHVNEVNLDDYIGKLELAVQSKNCIAIGEIGLDKIYKSSYQKQIIVFEQQLLLAQKYNLPIIIHNVKSLNEIMGIIKNNNFKQPIIFHGYTGKLQTAQQILRIGAYISFGKSLMAFNLHNIINCLPIDRLFFETDESNYSIEEIYNKASTLLNISVENCKQIIYNNFIKVFRKYNA